MFGSVSLREHVTRFRDPHWLRALCERHRQQPGLRGLAARQLEIVLFTARHLRRGELSGRAAALTYHTLLAIVPMLAVGFALFKAFGGLQKLEAPLREWIVHNLAVGRAEEVGRWLDQFINNISAGAIAGVGVLLLFYSAVGLLTNSESAFNRIWGVEQGRPLHLRFAVYWCLLTIGPALMGVSISVSAQLQRSAFASMVLGWLPFGLGRWLLSLGSLLAICALFVLAYTIVPNTKVHLRPAIAGGVLAGVLWSLTKGAFFWVSAGSVKYSAVYGALGALPLLMIWLYTSWLIVLFGMTYVYARQVSASGLQEPTHATSWAFREHLAARLAVLIARAHEQGAAPPNASEIAERLAAPVGLVRKLLGILSQQQIVVQTGQALDGGYLPARDLQHLSLQDVIDALRSKHGERPALLDDATEQRLREIFEQVDKGSREALSKIDLRTLEPK